MNDSKEPLAGMTTSRGGKKLLWFAAAPAVLCTLGLLVLLQQAHASKTLATDTRSTLALPVNVVRAQQGNATNEVVLPATLQAYDDSPVYARTNGYVRQWYANIGERVKAGQVLALIDAPEVDQQLLHAKAVLNQSQANLSLAAVTAKRYQELIKDNAVAQQQVDQNNQNLVAQQANVKAAAADVASLEQQQAYERVVAPFDGVVTERRTDIGDLINAGNSGPGTELFRVAKLTTMRIFIPVPEEYSQQIQDGLGVSVELTELPGKRFDGQVTRSTRSINVASRTLLVEVDVANPDDTLLPGAYAKVHIGLPVTTRPLLVPAGAILFQSAGPQVAVVNRDHQIELRRVSIGNDYGNTIEITGGITADDNVVANPPDYIVNGMPVVVEASTPESKPLESKPVANHA